MILIFIIFIKMNSNGSTYVFKSKHAGRVLDVCQDTDKKGLLILYDAYGGANQSFILKESGV